MRSGGRVCHTLGKAQYSRAVVCLQEAIKSDTGPVFRSLLGHVFGLLGEKPKALQMIAELRGLERNRYVSPVDYAIVCAGLRDADATFSWM